MPTVPREAGLGRWLAWLTVPRLWLVVVLGAIGAMQLAVGTNAVDLAYHVRAGALMVDAGHVLRTDVFAWTTAGQPWLDQNWGAQLVLYGLWRVGGFPLIAIVNALVTVAAWGLVMAACRRRTASLRVIAGSVLVAHAGAMSIFAARPQMFSVLLFAIELYLLEVARRRPRVLVALPVLMAVWVNLHGAFVVGLAVLGIDAAVALARRDRPASSRLLLTGAASVLALLLNPWGPGVLRYVADLAGNRSVTAGVTEWAPTSVRDPAGAALLGAMAVLVVALARAGSLTRAADQLARLVPLALLALWTARAGVWFGLVLPLALAALARERTPRPARDDRGSPLITAAMLLVVALAVTVAAPGVRDRLVPGMASRPALASAPVATGDWLAAHPQAGRMLNYQPWGSYLEFRLGPAVKPAVDSRIELTPASVWTDYHAIMSGRWDAQRLLDARGVAYVVTDAEATPDLVADLDHSAGWRLAFAHHEERVYLRR
ncbi:MAG TPA: hypothetical protein VF486_22960 [Actinomycetes bacterium]